MIKNRIDYRKITLKDEGLKFSIIKGDRNIGHVLFQNTLPRGMDLFLDKYQLESLKWFDSKSVYVEEIFIKPAHRGKGHFKTVLSSLEHEFRKKGKESIALIPSIMDDKYDKRSLRKRWEILLASYKKANYKVMSVFHTNLDYKDFGVILIKEIKRA